MGDVVPLRADTPAIDRLICVVVTADDSALFQLPVNDDDAATIWPLEPNERRIVAAALELALVRLREPAGEVPFR